jgi:hypothetical protein
LRTIDLRVKLIVFGCLASLLMLFSCQCHDNLCGSGEYRCAIFFDTSPQVHPVESDILNNFILFENGILLTYNVDFGDRKLINIDSICGYDSTRDVIFYNENTESQIYTSPHQSPSPSDYFTLIVLSNRCCKLDTNFNKISEFGVEGSPESILGDAVVGAIDLQGNCYIADRADSSIKVYDKNGDFFTRWPNIGIPVKIKLRDDVMYILDGSTDKIAKYTMAASYLGDQPGISGLSKIVAFGFTYKDMIWVADQDGTRLSRFSLSGKTMEVKTEYCHKDVNYSFGHISYIDGFLDVVELVDRDANRLLSFSRGAID